MPKGILQKEEERAPTPSDQVSTVVVIVLPAPLMGVAIVMAMGTVLVHVFAVRAMVVSMNMFVHMAVRVFMGVSGAIRVGMLVNVGVLMLMRVSVVISAPVSMGVLSCLSSAASAILAHIETPFVLPIQIRSIGKIVTTEAIRKPR